MPVERLIGDGKRLRPLLVMGIVSALQGEVNNAAITCGAAVELAHLGSLVHDDIIDEAATRRGVPTVSAKEGLNVAVLAGDYLLAASCARASYVTPEATSLMAESIMAICSGETRELADAYNPHRTRENLQKSMYEKTAALLAVACRMGGICAKADEVTKAALENYGVQFGYAFQLLDDLLDFLSTPELLRKPVGNDVREGTYTLPILLGMQSEHADEIAHILAAKADANVVSLTQLLWDAHIFHNVLREIRQCTAAAAHAVHKVPHTTFLAQFPDAYIDWALQSLLAPQYKTILSLSADQ